MHLGLPETAFAHESGLITKWKSGRWSWPSCSSCRRQVLWDVGAGCGSVGLEASLLLPRGQVFAVEQQPERARQIMTSRSRFGAGNLEVVNGMAPECLATLPCPDRVFIGGGGSRIHEILEAVLTRYPAPGRVVLTAALLATLQTAGEVLQARGWEVEACRGAGQPVPGVGEQRLFAGAQPGLDYRRLTAGDENMSERQPVLFVGAGPGDPELITLKGQQALVRADLILYTGS